MRVPKCAVPSGGSPQAPAGVAARGCAAPLAPTAAGADGEAPLAPTATGAFAAKARVVRASS
eukprot:13515045-Alexandrium_andersonii.AAC.1